MLSFFSFPSPASVVLTLLSSQGLIKSIIQSPHDALAANTWMVLEVAGVRLTAEIGLATILGDSEEGLPLSEIAEKTKVDALKLGSSSLDSMSLRSSD